MHTKEFTIKTTYSEPKLMSTLSIPLNILQNLNYSKAEKLATLLNKWARSVDSKIIFGVSLNRFDSNFVYKIYVTSIADNEEYREVTTEKEYTILLYTLQESFDLVQK